MWKCKLKNGTDLCVNEGQESSEYRVSRKEKSRYLTVWFSRKTAVLESRSMFSVSISHVENDGEA